MKGWVGFVMFMLAMCLQVRAQSKGTAAVEHGSARHTRALEILQAERARAKQPLCPNAVVTLAINECLSAEVTKTDGNYLKLVRALGALIRSGRTGAPTRLPFDDAETAWASYRDLACRADGSLYEGGTMEPSVELGCHITITQHHMEELWALYSDADL